MKFLKPKPGASFAWRYHYGLKTLRRAYEFSRIASDKEKAWIEAKAEKHQKLVDKGEASWVEYDDEGNAGHDYGEHLGELLYEEEQVLALLRQAFVISLHHFVEQQIGPQLPKKHYKQNLAIEWLEKFGWQSKEKELNELRLTANCLKHSNDNPGKQLYDLRPDLFDGSKIKMGFEPGHHSLALTDEHLDYFFAAVGASVPSNLGIAF